MIDKLIGVIPIICKNINSTPLKMLQDRRSAGGGTAFPKVALANDVTPFGLRFINEFCKLICLGKISIIGIAVITEIFNINIGNQYVKYPVADITEIYARFLGSALFARATKADHRRVFRKISLYQLFYGFSGINLHIHHGHK